MCHVGIDRALFVSEGGCLFRAFIPRLHASMLMLTWVVVGMTEFQARQFC